ncbi:hypothetical protein KSP40_PGU001504 [Platanthera guangdongensis]|uniref:Heparan-alpha-glucosaminide N-acetyltransferase n=1 Tax=Platanthera guangdongensis TaxID=2320717 RepID=A0ABR2M3Z4_9ASPA
MGAFVQIEGGFSHAPNNLSYGVDMKMIYWCGILQRIAPAYLVVALIEVLTHKFRPREIGSNPFSIFKGYSWQWIECEKRGKLSPTCNAVGYVDRAVWGINLIYSQPVWRRSRECTFSSLNDGPLRDDAPSWCLASFDPEGLLSSMSAILSTTIGVHYGHVLIHYKVHSERLKHFMIMAIGLLLCGLILHLSNGIHTHLFFFWHNHTLFYILALFGGTYLLDLYNNMSARVEGDSV